MQTFNLLVLFAAVNAHNLDVKKIISTLKTTLTLTLNDDDALNEALNDVGTKVAELANGEVVELANGEVVDENITAQEIINLINGTDETTAARCVGFREGNGNGNGNGNDVTVDVNVDVTVAKVTILALISHLSAVAKADASGFLLTHKHIDHIVGFVVFVVSILKTIFKFNDLTDLIGRDLSQGQYLNEDEDDEDEDGQDLTKKFIAKIRKVAAGKAPGEAAARALEEALTKSENADDADSNSTSCENYCESEILGRIISIFFHGIHAEMKCHSKPKAA